MYSAIALAVPLDTALTKRGSNLAASNSFTIALAAVIPSFAAGALAGLEEKDEEREEETEKDDETDSLSRFVERVR